MKKFYLRFLCLLLLAGVVSASPAQDTYAPDESVLVQEIVADEVVYLKGWFDQTWLCGNALSSKATADCAFRFVAAGEKNVMDGGTTYVHKTWYLQQVSTGKYLSYVDMTDDISNATTFFVEKAVPTASPNVSSNECLLSEVSTKYGYSEEGGWVLTYADWFPDYKYRLISFYQQLYCNLNYTDTSTDYFYGGIEPFFIYPAVGLQGRDKLYTLFNNLFPNDVETSTIFIEGDDLGQVPSEYYQALEEARRNAEDVLYSDQTFEDEVYETARDALDAAYDAARSHIVMPTPGYYRIRTAALDANGYMFAYDGSVYYDYTGTGYEVPAVEDLGQDDANYIWKFETDEASGSAWHISNLGEPGRITCQQYVSQTLTSSGNAWWTFAHERTRGAFYFQASNSLTWMGYGGYVYGYPVTSDGTAWYIERVDPAEIEALRPILETAQLYRDAQAASISASERLDRGWDRNISASKVWTNAQEPTEGPIANAVDVTSGSPDYTTFFHTAWTTEVEGYHNFCVDLGELTNQLRFRWTMRSTENCNVPTLIDFYGATELAETDSVSGDSWEYIKTDTIIYDQKMVINGTLMDGYAAMYTLNTDKPYRNFRMDIVKTNTDKAFVSASDIRFFSREGDEHAANSFVPQEVISRLQDAIGDVEEAIADSTLAQSHLDALSAALQDYIDQCPDGYAFSDFLAEVQGLAAGMQEGTTAGYFPAGTPEAIAARIGEVAANVSADGSVDFSKLDELNEKLKVIEADIHRSMIRPVDGFYRLVSATPAEDAGGSFIYPAGSDATLSWSGSKTDAAAATKMTYLWQVTNREDGTITMRNLFSGSYLGRASGSLQYVTMTPEPAAIPLEFSGTAGTVNLVQDEGFFVHVYMDGGLVTWNARGESGTFRFAPESDLPWETAHYVAVKTGNAAIYTMPFDVTDLVDATAYEILGVTDTSLELKELEEGETIEKGVPFIAVTDGESEGFYVIPAGEDMAGTVAAGYAGQPGERGNLVGVLASTNVDGRGLNIHNNAIVYTGQNAAVAANTGYIRMAGLPKAENPGDLSIPFSDDVVTAITNVTVNTPAASQGIYDLSGRRVRQAQKGLYIVNGKKVIVK